MTLCGDMLLNGTACEVSGYQITIIVLYSSPPPPSTNVSDGEPNFFHVIIGSCAFKEFFKMPENALKKRRFLLVNAIALEKSV